MLQVSLRSSSRCARSAKSRIHRSCRATNSHFRATKAVTPTTVSSGGTSPASSRMAQQGQGAARLPGRRSFACARGSRRTTRAASRRGRCCSRMPRSPTRSAASCATRSVSARTGFDLAYAREGRLTCGWTTGRSGRWAPGVSSRSCHGEDFDFELDLAATQPPLLQGERGFSRKGPGPARGELLLQPAAACGHRRQRRRTAARARQRRGMVRP